MLDVPLESLLHVLGITQSWLAETGGSQMLLHRPVRLKAMTNWHSINWGSTSRSTRCAQPAVGVGRQRPLGAEGLESQREGAKCQVREIETESA